VLALSPDIDLPPVPPELRPPPPAWRGRGLIVGAAVAAGVNIALVGARFGLSLGESDASRETARLYLTAVATPIDIVAGVGLAAGAGHVRGRWDGYRTAFAGGPKLRAKAFVQSGATLLVISAVGYALAWTPWHGDPALDARGGGTLLIEAVASVVLIGATGITAYGVSWQKHAERYVLSRPLALRPVFAPGYTGLALAGRF
jgi:hypothetical protein